MKSSLVGIVVLAVSLLQAAPASAQGAGAALQSVQEARALIGAVVGESNSAVSQTIMSPAFEGTLRSALGLPAGAALPLTAKDRKAALNTAALSGKVDSAIIIGAANVLRDAKSYTGKFDSNTPASLVAAVAAYSPAVQISAGLKQVQGAGSVVAGSADQATRLQSGIMKRVAAVGAAAALSGVFAMPVEAMVSKVVLEGTQIVGAPILTAKADECLQTYGDDAVKGLITVIDGASRGLDQIKANGITEKSAIKTTLFDSIQAVGAEEGRPNLATNLCDPAIACVLNQPAVCPVVASK